MSSVKKIFIAAVFIAAQFLAFIPAYAADVPTITGVSGCPSNFASGNMLGCTNGKVSFGQTIVISGSGFSTELSKNSVKVNGKSISVAKASTTGMTTAVIPNNWQAAVTSVVVTVSGQKSNAFPITVGSPVSGGGVTDGSQTGNSGQSLVASPSTYKMSDNNPPLSASLFNGPNNGRFCVYIFSFGTPPCDVNGVSSGTIGAGGAGTAKFTISPTQPTGTSKLKAYVVDKDGKVVSSSVESNVVQFVSAAGAGDSTGGVDCELTPEDPDCQTAPGGGGTGGTGGGSGGVGSGSGPGGLIGEGIKHTGDKFDTSGKITGSKTFGELINNVIDIVLGLVLTVAMLFLIIGGYQYITAAGNEAQAKTGRKTITYAVLGIIFIMLAYTIVTVVSDFVMQ